MKDRVGARGVPPDELLRFDGRRFATYTEWMAAFDGWCRRREAWEAEHECVVLPEGEMLGECPQDPEWQVWSTHGADVWSRPPSGGAVRCGEHGLTVEEHYVAPSSGSGERT